MERFSVYSGNGSQRRLVRITPGNVRNNHIYVREHLDFFPPDCIGPSKRNGNGDGHCIELILDGLEETVTTDIGKSSTDDNPRGFFRGRKWVRRFFKCHDVNAGDLLAIDRVEERRYRLSVGRRALAIGDLILISLH
jgi:hypothetical protein